MTRHKDRQTAQSSWEKLSQATDAYQRKAYALDEQQTQDIQIIPDETVSAAKFLPKPGEPGIYLAHPLTIQAMKKDIFVLGDDVVFTMRECKQCTKRSEAECWNCCPHCGSDFLR